MFNFFVCDDCGEFIEGKPHVCGDGYHVCHECMNAREYRMAFTDEAFDAYMDYLIATADIRERFEREVYC